MVSFVADARNPGTAEAVWHPHLEGLAALLVPRVAKAVVVAPHPDDEVLAVGGLMRHLERSGTELVVVAVTDGEGSHRSEPAAMVSDVRRREVEAAYRALGVAPSRHIFAVPDGSVADHEDHVMALLADLVGCGDLVVAPWEGDGHPDHDGAGRAAVRAAGAVGAALLAYPVWAWHWAHPDAGDLPLPRAARHDLSDADQRAKAAAVAAFSSQLAPRPGPDPDPILGPAVLARFTRPFEVLFCP